MKYKVSIEIVDEETKYAQKTIYEQLFEDGELDCAAVIKAANKFATL
jgi:hypothetical protein